MATPDTGAISAPDPKGCWEYRVRYVEPAGGWLRRLRGKEYSDLPMRALGQVLRIREKFGPTVSIVVDRRRVGAWQAYSIGKLKDEVPADEHRALRAERETTR